jgi:hypothetical protein
MHYREDANKEKNKYQIGNHPGTNKYLRGPNTK